MRMNSERTKKLTLDWPERLSFDSTCDRIVTYYSEKIGITTERESIFYKKRLLDVFLFALALGKQKGIRTKVLKKSRVMPTDALREEEIWLMTSIALSEDNADLDILTKPDEIVNICEEYANTGINTLVTLDFTSTGSDPLEPYENLLQENLEKANN